MLQVRSGPRKQKYLGIKENGIPMVIDRAEDRFKVSNSSDNQISQQKSGMFPKVTGSSALLKKLFAC